MSLYHVFVTGPGETSERGRLTVHATSEAEARELAAESIGHRADDPGYSFRVVRLA
jgi:hypothetical protein